MYSPWHLLFASTVAARDRSHRFTFSTALFNYAHCLPKDLSYSPHAMLLAVVVDVLTLAFLAYVLLLLISCEGQIEAGGSRHRRHIWEREEKLVDREN